MVAGRLSVYRTPGLLDTQEKLTRTHRASFADSDLLDGACLWRADVILHLHRFDNHHGLIECNGIALAHKHADDLPGHLGAQALQPCAPFFPCYLRTQDAGVPDLESVPPFPANDMKKV